MYDIEHESCSLCSPAPSCLQLHLQPCSSSLSTSTLVVTLDFLPHTYIDRLNKNPILDTQTSPPKSITRLTSSPTTTMQIKLESNTSQAMRDIPSQPPFFFVSIVSELRLHGFPAAVPVGRSEHLVQELQQLADNEDLFYFLFRLMLLAAPRRVPQDQTARLPGSFPSMGRFRDRERSTRFKWKPLLQILNTVPVVSLWSSFLISEF